jgi:hypothetical protein
VTVATAVADGAIDFHGIPISLEYEPFERDAFRTLFAGFGRRSTGSDALRVKLRASPTRRAAAVTQDFSPTFCHGLVQAYSRDGAHVLSDGQSRIEVLPRLGRMSGEVFERADSDVSSGMQHIALSLLLRERGIFDVHAATACTDERALVLIGDSGAGKTTLLLSLMELGCDFLGDDRLLFRAQAQGSELLAYPREFHLSPTTLQVLQTPLAHLPEAPLSDGKYSIEPLRAWPKRFRHSWRGPITLILPRIEDQTESRVRRATAAEAFGKLLSSSGTVVVEAIERRPEQLHALKVLADTAEAYDVALGSDLLKQPIATARRIVGAIKTLAHRS